MLKSCQSKVTMRLKTPVIPGDVLYFRESSEATMCNGNLFALRSRISLNSVGIPNEEPDSLRHL